MRLSNKRRMKIESKGDRTNGREPSFQVGLDRYEVVAAVKSNPRLLGHTTAADG